MKFSESTYTIKFILDYDEKLTKLKSILDRQYREIINYEKRTKNKTSEIYRRGLQQRLEDFKRTASQIKRVNTLTANKLRQTDDKTTEYFVNNQEKIQKYVANTSKKMETGISGYVSKFKKAFATLSRYFLSYMVLNTVADAIRNIVTELLNVNKALASVRAITEGSVSDLKQLKNVIFDVSAQYGIAASNVAKFTIEMAKMGKSVDEIKILADGRILVKIWHNLGNLL